MKEKEMKMKKFWGWLPACFGPFSGRFGYRGGYPSKEINFMIAFNAGGESDIEFRIMQPFLEKAFGVRFVPEYKPAAGGALAWNFLAAATPDGYMIGGFNAPHIITQPLTMNDVTYKTDGFTYLCMIENTPVALCTKKEFPANTLKELIDYAKANPGKVTAGGVGKNSGPHLAALQFQKLAGVKFTYIPFQGTGQLKPAIMGGHVDVVFTNSPAAVEMLPLNQSPRGRNREAHGAVAQCAHVCRGWSQILPAYRSWNFRPTGTTEGCF
jgi:tripartite-type tricarboxylate transporter receptor subunit TctC